MGKGTGNLYIKSFSADHMIVSKTYDIQDYWLNDPASAEGIAKYDSTTHNMSKSTFSYDSTQEAYKLIRNSGEGFFAITLPNILLGKHLEVELDVMCPSDNSSINNQPAVCIYNTETGKGIGLGVVYYGTYEKSWCLYSNHPYLGGGTKKRTYSLPNRRTNYYYHYKLTIDGTSVTAEIDDMVLTDTLDELSEDSNIFGITHCYYTNATVYFKNIKIKVL